MQLQRRHLKAISPLRSNLRALASGLLGLVVLFSMIAVPAHAQEFRGTLSGKVTDTTGAVIPKANVTVTEVNTGTVSHTISGADGEWVVPFLLPGTYKVQARATGFESIVRNAITLQAQEHPIIDLAMAVGQASETVTVTSAAPLIDQANASVGQVISTQSVADLPLNGRTPAVLTELSVGVITTAAPQLVHPFDNNAGNSWSIGGTPNQVSEVLLDGSPDLTLLGALAYSPSEDSVQEISIRPFDTDASFGHTIGGVINQVTKSGTNSYHGTVYEFSQISNLDANTYFNDRANPVPKLAVTHFNQYGLTFGGPVVLPKLYNGKDKLFYFFAFEGLKDSQPATTTTTVPTAAEEAGDFSQTLAAGCPGGYANNPMTAAAICLPSGSNKTNYGDPNQLYNPFTAAQSGSNVNRSPILNNNLTTAGPLNPVTANYLKLFPAPNNTSGVAADGQGNYISNAPSIDTYNNEFGRLDYNLGTRNHLFFDFRHNNRTQVKNNYFGNNSTGTNLLRENWGSTLDEVFTLNPTTIFDARFNWTYFDEVHGTPAQAYNPTELGFPAAITSSSEHVQLPCVNFTTSSTLGSCGTGTSYQNLGDTSSALDPTTNYQAFVDVIKVIGRQTLKIGFDGRQYRLRVQSFGNSSGAFNFTPTFVESGTTGSNQTFGGDLADFYFGLPTVGQYDLAAKADYRSYYIGTFVQDDWRATDHLTFNLGVRFDIDTPYGDKFGRTVNGFNPAATNSATSAAVGAFKPTTVTADGQTFTLNSINAAGGLTFPSTHGGAPFQTNSGFLSPRIGFSYAPPALHDRTVIRGGFGIFVQPETVSNLNAAGTYSSTPINNQEGFTASTQYVASTNGDLTPANSLSNPFPNGFVQPAGSSQGASTFLGQAISFLSPIEHDPYSERYDLGLQHSLTSNTLLEVLYVGNHSLHLPVASQNLNATERQYLTTAPYLNEGLASEYGKTVTNPFKGLLPNSASCNGSTTKLSSLLVPYPQFCNAAVTEQNQTIGQSHFNSVIVHVEQREKHGLTLTANYSFSKLLEADTFLNDSDSAPTLRVSPLDHTHHFTAGATYQLPFGRGKMFAFNNSRLADELFGGFVVNGVYQFQTGAPIEFPIDIPLQPGKTIKDIKSSPRNTSPVPSSGTGNPALSTAVFVTGSSTTCPTTGACDGTAFINGQYSNHLRTFPQTLSTVRVDGFNNLDASILKDFHFTEKSFLQLRFETFNTLNHPVFASPNVSSATASNFGYITSTYASSLPRQVQLGGRIVF
jgi:hypothetical protein